MLPVGEIGRNVLDNRLSGLPDVGGEATEPVHGVGADAGKNVPKVSKRGLLGVVWRWR